jgi:CO/xanthine dehydrogenase FAD-binding subunit
MTDRVREFHRPESADAAMRLLRRAEVRTAALLLGPRVPDALLEGVEAAVDLQALGLAGVTVEAGGGLRVGAMTSLQALAESEAARGLAGGILAEAAHLAGGSALRQAATVGGAVQQHLGAMAGVTREGPPEVALALLVLEAMVVLEGGRQTTGDGRSAGEQGPAPMAGRGWGTKDDAGGQKLQGAGRRREVALAEYYATGGMLAMDELLVEIRVPAQPAGARGALARVARTPRDQAIVAAAALRGEGVLRVALAGATPRPVRMREVEGMGAMKAGATEELAAMVAAATEARGDFRASAEYRRAMAGVMVKRALARVTSEG